MTDTPPSKTYLQTIIELVNENGMFIISASAITGAFLAVFITYFSRRNKIAAQKNKEHQVQPIKKEKPGVLTKDEMMQLLMKGKGKINCGIVRNDEKSKRPPSPIKKKEPVVVTSEEAEDSDDSEDLETNKEPTSSKTRHASSDEEMNDAIAATFGKLHGKLSTAQLKAQTRLMASKMSKEEKDYEENMKAKQMESILALMMQDKEKFGMSNEDDIKEQLNLYNF